MSKIKHFYVSNTQGCPLPEILAHGSYILQRNRTRKIVPGELVDNFEFLLYSCEDGYELSTKNTFCQEDNTWNSQPTCSSKACLTIAHFSVFSLFTEKHFLEPPSSLFSKTGLIIISMVSMHKTDLATPAIL